MSGSSGERKSNRRLWRDSYGNGATENKKAGIIGSRRANGSACVVCLTAGWHHAVAKFTQRLQVSLEKDLYRKQ